MDREVSLSIVLQLIIFYSRVSHLLTVNKDGCTLTVNMTQLTATQTCINQNLLAQAQNHSSALENWQGADEQVKSNGSFKQVTQH